MPASDAASEPRPGLRTGDDESAFERVALGDVEIAFVDLGPTGEATATALPLILLHGFTGHRDDWVGVLPKLAEHRRVVALDLRGHGDSSSPEEPSAYSFKCLVKDVIGLLDHLDIPRCDLLGHSVGGMIAQRLVAWHPDRFRSLILMNTAPEMPASIPQSGLERAAEIAEAKGMAGLQQLAEAAAKNEGDPMIALWGERYWRHQRRRLTAMTPASYRGIGLELYTAGSFAAHLPEIHCPTLVLVGTEDAGFLKGFEALKAGLPEATTRCLRIEGAGHHPHQENPSAWFSALEKHFSKLSLST